MEKSAAGGGAVAVPVSALVCGDPAALSLTESVAASVPAAVGSNATEMVQDAPAASVALQVFVLAKAALLVPVRLMPVMASGAVPELVSVAVCAAVFVPVSTEPKSSLDGVRVAAGDAEDEDVPVPARDEDCVPAESVTEKEPLLTPECAGVKTTVYAQVAPAVSVVEQVLPVSAKGAVSEVCEVMVRLTVPVLVRVSV